MNFIFRTSMVSKFVFRNEIVTPYEMTDENDYEYKIAENSVTITKYTGSAKNIAIPQKIEGLTVTKIGGGAFTGTAVEAVKIPEGVEEIE